MKITFLKDTGPIADSGWEFYPKGAKADLTGGAALVAAGYAREGWEGYVAPPDPKPAWSILDPIEAVKKKIVKTAGPGPDPGPSPLPEPDPREGEPPPPPVLKVDLEDKTVRELRQMAKAEGVTGFSGMKKADLVKELADD